MEQLKHFLNWYFALFSNPDDKIKLAAWSATVASMTFAIVLIIKPIRLWFSGLFKKVKVNAGINQIFITSPFGATTASPELTCTITNKSERSIFIKQPAIKTSKKNENGDTFNVHTLKPKGTYPMKLEPGQQHKFECNIEDLYSQVLKDFDDKDNVKFMVALTTEKRYLSNPILIETIVENLKAARQYR